MKSEEIEKVSKCWAANTKAPLTRDQQILFMKTAKERRLEVNNRHTEMMKGQDEQDV